ncbi:unnamed protein product [Parnassius apollo]|uniref:(apollo) hypothetical protein n=1 Tax=Parnassius apollo TaxID=110799 RepID=A0A8S3WUL5_PARAO|nr:unnamed protein product [Parnassius apollo]
MACSELLNEINFEIPYRYPRNPLTNILVVPASEMFKEIGPKKKKAAGHKSQTVTEEEKQKTNKKKHCR